MSHRRQLNATIVASYVIACLALALCLDRVLKLYESAVETTENAQLERSLNREVSDAAWREYASSAVGLARDVTQDSEASRLFESKDPRFGPASQDLLRRSSVTSGAMGVLGFGATTTTGDVFMSEGNVPINDPDLNAQALISQRKGVDRVKVLTCVWLFHGRPVLTVIYPIGGLRPVGYFVLHTDPLSALARLDEKLGMTIAFQSLDGKTRLAALENWRPDPAARLRRSDVIVRGPEGAPIMLAATGRDVTARVASLDRIRLWSFVFLVGTFVIVAGLAIALVLWLTRRIAEEQANEFSRFAIEHMPQGICVFDKNERLVMCNHRYFEIYDLDPERAKPGVTLQEILSQRIDQGQFSGDSPEAYARERLEAARSPEVWTRLQHLPNGRCLSVFHRPMKGGGWISTQEDISDRVQIEARIAHMAHHDALTDLPNRVLLRERMCLAFESRRKSEEQWAFLLLDLDRFKEVNDALGHPIGDALLKAVASRLRLCVREGDTVARLGGDEFAILQASPGAESDSDALARRIIEALSEPFEINGHSLSIGASIGVAFAPKDAAEPDELIRNADLALYRAKSTGRGRHHFFEPDLDLQMQARRALEQGLRKALAENEFELFYQPIVNLEEDKICSFEALLRWNKPAEGRLAPSDFIDVAEESGLMVDIGRWVLRQACLEAVAWPGELLVAVNVSPSQFKSRQFLPMVKEALAVSGLPAARLELEITETVVLESGCGAFEILEQLHDLGVRLALDDFGTGYSSLTSLRQFPFNKIKIDRSFVSDMSKGTASSCAIVRSVAGLGISLGMSTTAEGVETQDQLDQVRAMGCTEMQGYFFCPPRPAKEVLQMLQLQCGLMEYA